MGFGTPALVSEYGDSSAVSARQQSAAFARTVSFPRLTGRRLANILIIQRDISPGARVGDDRKDSNAR